MFKINFNFDVHRFKLIFYRNKLRKIANLVFKKHNFKDDIYFDCNFVSLSQIHEINKQYRNIDRPTDVISFALWDNGVKTNLLGEMFICYEKIVEQSKEYNHSFKREICFLFTHGLLHLLGYDHMTEEDEKKMFTLQDDVLNELGIVRKW